MWLDEPGLSQYGHGAVGSLMEAYVSRRLVDRKAIDYEAVAKAMHQITAVQRKELWEDADQDWYLRRAVAAVAAAIGDTE